jgi:hypothetical protein
LDGPVIVPASGNGFTVIDFVATAEPHASTTEYDMVAVPADTPVTIPVVPTLAIAVELELHTPPVAGSVRVIVEATQTEFGPDMVPAERNAPMVTAIVETAVPHGPVTV